MCYTFNIVGGNGELKHARSCFAKLCYDMLCNLQMLHAWKECVYLHPQIHS
jgi:hypothetical protein